MSIHDERGLSMNNAVQWNTRLATFYEVWYLTVVHRATGTAFWLRSTLLKPKSPEPEQAGGLWFARFDPHNPARTFAAVRHFSAEDIAFEPGRFSVRVGPSSLREGAYTGDLSQNGHTASWDLQWTPNAETVGLIPELVRKARINKAEVCAPNVHIALYGKIVVDGEKYVFDGDPAGQAHHWGRHYPVEWIWGHCNAFAGRPDAWLEALSVKQFEWRGQSLPVTLLQLKTESLRFGVDSPLQLLSSRAEYERGVWRFAASDVEHRVEAMFTAPAERFVVQPYTSPHNQAYWCHNSCLADLSVRLSIRRGREWETVDELVSHGAAAAEFCTRRQTTPDEFVFKGIAPGRWDLRS
ncbi:MAG: hypothetical protein C4523_03200 [Myxococcales bacterium]|nr:MAG: hypothetical protein C4523_03200 [Myxococcales bacterium]